MGSLMRDRWHPLARRVSRSPLPVVHSSQTLNLWEDSVVDFGDEDADLKEISAFYSTPGSTARYRGYSDMTTTTTTSCSTMTRDSSYRFAEPAQTLLFLDWDDTLFPTTELFRRHELFKGDGTQNTCEIELPAALSRDMEKWAEAVRNFLSIARGTCDRIAVITNSKKPWVDTCIDKFAPQLRPLFDGPESTLHVVYAEDKEEAVRADVFETGRSGHSSCCFDGWRAKLEAWASKWVDEDDEEHEAKLREKERRLTKAKHDAMQREATNFYSRYPGQTWKNIVCMGDAKFEHDAVHELASGRLCVSPKRERLRTKTILTPRGPSVMELTLHLEFSRLLLRPYAGCDGDFDLDLSRGDPLDAIASTLQIPQLRSVPVPRATWGLGEDAIDEEAAWEALDQVAITIQDWMQQLPDLHGDRR